MLTNFFPLHLEDIAYVDASDQPIAHIDSTLMHDRYLALMHWSLEEALYEAVADSVEIRYSTTPIAVESSPENVVVTFNDGIYETFDVLIGADGVHSRIRRLIFGMDASFQHYLGYCFASYQLPDRYGIGHAWKNYAEPGCLAGAYCSNQEGEIVTFLMYKTADERPMPRALRLSHLQTVFAGMGWITQRLLDDVIEPEAIFLDAMTQIQIPCWHRGRVALIGDPMDAPLRYLDRVRHWPWGEPIC